MLGRCVEKNLLCLVGSKVNGIASVENSMAVAKKIKIELPYYPEIYLLRVYPKELKAGFSGNICTLMCISNIIHNS